MKTNEGLVDSGINNSDCSSVFTELKNNVTSSTPKRDIATSQAKCTLPKNDMFPEITESNSVQFASTQTDCNTKGNMCNFSNQTDPVQSLSVQIQIVKPKKKGKCYQAYSIMA